MEEMDKMPFPQQMLNSTNSTIPKHITLWGQLKQFVSKNPHILGTNVDLPKLQHLQRLHIASTLAQRQESNRNPDQANQMGMPNFAVPPGNLGGQETFPRGQQTIQTAPQTLPINPAL